MKFLARLAEVVTAQLTLSNLRYQITLVALARVDPWVRYVNHGIRIHIGCSMILLVGVTFRIPDNGLAIAMAVAWLTGFLHFLRLERVDLPAVKAEIERHREGSDVVS